LALIYVDRLIQRSNFLLTELNVHRVVITAVLLAAKFFDDAYYNNAYYAKVGGVLVSEMNGLEVDFLFRINFSLHVTPDVFEKYRAELMMHSVAAPAALDHQIYAPVCRTVPVHQQTAHHVDFVRSPPYITPSPPREACQQEAMVVCNPSMDNNFLPVTRANSLPMPTRPSYYVPPHHRCAQDPFSAPATATYHEEQYVIMENQIYQPLQNKLVHHHHGMPADGYNAQMLTGASGL
jgi:hypothetical protein